MSKISKKLMDENEKVKAVSMEELEASAKDEKVEAISRQIKVSQR